IKIDLHIFGFARPNLIKPLQNMGVTSFDSASALRSAWLSGKNYFTAEKNYKAIRIPNPERTRAKRRSEKSLSLQAMKALRDFEKGKGTIEDVLIQTIKYGNHVAIEPK